MKPNAKPITLQVVRDVLPDGTMIPLLFATIKRVYPMKDGTYTKGKRVGQKWTLQNLVLTDAEGTELDAKLDEYGREISKTWEGRDVMISSYEGDQKTTGVYAHDDSYDGKRKLRLTKTGNIDLVTDGPDHHHEEPQGRQYQRPPQQPQNQPQNERQQRQQAPPQQPQGQRRTQRHQEEWPQEEAPTQTAEERLKITLDQMKDARKSAYQVANLQLMCLTITETYTAPRLEAKTKKKLTDEDKHAWAMNMAIDLVKAGQHRLMPTYPLEKLDALLEQTDTK